MTRQSGVAHFGDLAINQSSETDDEQMQTGASGTRTSNGSVLHERAIWTGTVFSGLRLSDKNVKTVVQYQVPTEIFKNPDLYSYDLRGSFVLIPKSPSSLDFVSNYSTWLPNSVTYPASRSWPDGYERTLAEEVVDAYGTFVPLLSFHNIETKCGNKDTLTVGKPHEFEEEEVEEDPEPSYIITITAKKQAKKRWDFSKKGRPPLQSHPYVKTKSLLHVANMTKLYNRKAYDKAHQHLRATAMISCGNSVPMVAAHAEFKQDWTSCTRTYSSNGNQEVKVKLQKKNENTGKDTTKWAYGPYLSVYDSDNGPLDLVSVPVNREDCTRKGEDIVQVVPDEEFVDIAWNIMFSVTAPKTLFLVEVLPGLPADYNMTDTKSKHLAKHAEIEMSHGFLSGHHYRDNYHPRRQLILKVLRYILDVVITILESHYWLTRSSTVGIAIFGGFLIACGNLIDGVFAKVIANSGDGLKSSAFLWSLLGNFFFQIPFFLMLKAILRAEFRWSRKGLPILFLAPASHVERASQRRESYPPMLWKALIFAILGSIYTLCYYYKIFIIAPRIILSAPRTRIAETLILLRNQSTFPAINLGLLLQITMNSKIRRFAGTYKMCSALVILSSILTIAGTTPWIVGDAPQKEGIYISKGVGMVLSMCIAYQACRFPSISRADEEDVK